ncbi:hypothetical protein ACFVZQ_10430, partial [Streptomyces sp. NPDC059538]
MNLRILGIELRRSVAPWAAVVVLAAALALLHLVSGPWAKGTALWTAQWTSMALWTRYPLIFLWPLAVGLGGLQGLRDHRSNMAELLISTPRPARHRAAALAGTTALALVSSFALLVLLGAVRVLAGDATYTHLGWLPVSLVGALALTAGSVLGMGIARTVPSALTPPALAVGAFLLTNLLRQTSDAATPTSAVPNRLSLLSPAVAAVALLQFPADPRATYVLDREAATPVCDGPVCVTTARRARIEDLAAPGAEALRLLHEALGDRAPAGVVGVMGGHAMARG